MSAKVQPWMVKPARDWTEKDEADFAQACADDDAKQEDAFWQPLYRQNPNRI